ncbi:succinate dehydrogenase assembly factor 2 [Wenxinia saemankumensis]|uniref:FAD assembly factor SdhE n=1 Tax=Wenxinia saemankumensis TaxID=1447782 RepID=A0A1M6CE38_9RHOB|nr:succinate dehydrogenase assembly factor 2 [Wenxinia saemankumensis]SHI59267.1 antitoxin CptB [Wenxinia saemankumensis]
MAEDRETRLRRLHMRSIRRGIKEMDLILGRFAVTDLPGLPEAELDLYEALLAENDHDLYAWIAGAAPVPDRYAALIARIGAGAVGVVRPA